MATPACGPIQPTLALALHGNEELQALWLAQREGRFSQDAQDYVRLATRFLELGESLLAFDVAQDGLQYWPELDDLIRIKALSLARCGAHWEANALLQALHDRNIVDEETVGMLARTYKDLWQAAEPSKNTALFLRRARELYEQAYLDTGNYWLGINAATLAVASGQLPAAKEYASRLQRALAPLAATTDSIKEDDYWMLATLGEACIIQGNLEQAERWYQQARGLTSARPGNIASSRRNARLLARHGCCDMAFVDLVLPQPRICVFSGHAADQDGRAEQRLPQAAEAQLYLKIKEKLQQLNIGIGFASAACGADILFLEAMLELGGEINIVLPFPPDIFIPTSVVRGNDDRWLARFHRLLAVAKSVSYAAGFHTGDVSFTYGNLILYGTAKSRVRQFDGQLHLLAVWDGKPGAEGGTGTNVLGWLASGEKVHIIAPDASEGRVPAAPPAGHSGGKTNSYWSSARQSEGCKLVSFLFADVVGYSKLAESEILPFVEHCFGGIAQLIEKSKEPPVVKNTWGDGLYFVFPSTRAAGIFALDLVEWMAATDWEAKGLPRNLQIRISLHCGPAYAVRDPITNQTTYYGSHVSRAARIEPITPPGQVYCSDAFAALCEADNVAEFKCIYVGQTSLAKKFGTFPTYRVERARLPSATKI
jgi:class 3 adenylate cyclase